jgi:hypothetical protein
MQRLLLSVVFFLTLGFAAGAADSPVAIEHGGDLQRLCNADRQSGEYAMCFSFIAAVLEVVNNNSIYALKVCVPPLVTVQKATDLTGGWLQTHPEARIKAASLVITEALAHAFPCSSN